jgi:predicted ATPase
LATAARTDESPIIRTPDQRLRVFVSSTLEELSEERAALRTAIDDLHLTPVMFELGASPHPPRALYRAYLEQSHVFVGIYWQRYGWVAPDMEVSGLEDEYLLSEGMPRLIYFKEPAEEREEPMTKFVRRIKAGDNSFRKFRTSEELAELLREDLAHLLTERFESIGSGNGAHERAPEPQTPATLPVPATRLIGRDQDSEQILEMLCWEDVRLVTLTGVGGIGKSRLALEVARRVQADGRSVIFVDLTSVTDPAEGPRAIAAALGVPDDGARPLLDGIAERLLEAGDGLLVLDNFEQITEAGRYVGDILARCPRLKVLVASRILLDIRGEHHWDVTPLPHPGDGSERTVDAMADCPAVELFVDRAQSADPRFVLSDENVDQVSELCGRLEGIPLALELTAAYVRFLPPAAMLERFDQRLDLEAHADHPDRQRTLRRTIEWSYGLLDEAECELFARLAVFKGGWDLRAAHAICGQDCRADVLQTLSNLVDKSLVTIVDGRGAEPRFRMLETVRVFAVERLTESGETAAMRLRHAEYFAELCEELGVELENHEIWYPRLDPDRENLLAIHERVAEDDRLLEPLIRVWAAVWSYAWARGLTRQVLEIMETMEGAAATIAGLSTEVRAKFAFLMGAGLFLTGDPDRGQSYSKQVLEFTDKTGDERLRALALLMLGASTPYETARDEAEAALVESVSLSRRLGFAIGLDMALAQLGIIRMRDGQLDEAIAMHEECLDLGRGLKSKPMTAFALVELAFDHLMKGELESARGYLVECAEVCRGLEREGNRETSAYCLEGFALVANARGNPELAARLGGASEGIRDVISAPVWALFGSMKGQFVEILRKELGDEAYEVAVTAGREMSTEDALAMGIGETA